MTTTTTNETGFAATSPLSTMTAAEERKARARANKALAALPCYHPHIPLADIDAILTRHGFTATAEAVYCGREGRSAEQVGRSTYLSLSWYRMDSGRYEIVAYLS